MRIKYWSESDWVKRLRSKYDIEKPLYATFEEWKVIDVENKRKHPLINWLTDDGIDLLQDIVMFIPDKLKEFKRASVWKFFRNLWVFRECLWNYRAWDHSGLLQFMETCARDMSDMHKESGMAVRSDETSKELLIWAELLKRVREDNYTFDLLDWVDLEEGEKGIAGKKFVQKNNTLPSYQSKSFYKMRNDVLKNDLHLAAKMFERKVLNWWD